MYKGLSRAQLSYDYLHTNSTTHEFLFGALAELLDNARDASATKINIYSVMDRSLRGGYMLCFLDDGQGMSPEEASDIITFGKSTKKSLDSQLIGMYGNGLKSGSMRIGNDFILFTKKGPTLTCVFLSRTFHENEQLDEIIVPMPSFDSQTKKPFAKTPREKEKHLIEMELILKYSPFKTEAQFMKEFDKIEGTSGCLVIIYNLKLLDSGEPELDVKTDSYDIILSNPEGGDIDSDEGLMPERKSFRAYASILYVEPRMRVYIQGKKVRTKRLISTLYKPRVYRYSSARFKTRSENEVKKAEEDSKSAENRAREAESKARNLELKLGGSTDKDQRAELRRAQAASVELRKEAQIKKAMAERKAKSLRDPKQLVFVFGINIDNRSRDGMFVYNCSRLIKMYQKVGPQAEGGVFCSGVIGVVDVPYLVLEPTHNKQDFADAKEYRHLQQAMGEHMVQYWKDMEIAQQGVTKFWENFGYVSPNWRDLPSNDPKYVRKRTAQVQITLQCDLCLKWRIIPFSANNIGKVFPDDWVCSMNPDPSHNRCSSAEEKLNLPEGILKKISKSKEQKEKDLQQEIKKKQVLLEKLQKNKTVSSSRTLHESSSSPQSSSSEEETERQHPSRHPNTRQFTTRSHHQAKSQVPAARREKLKRQSGKQRSRYEEEEEESSDNSRSSSEEPVAKKKVSSKSHTHGMMKRSSAPTTVQRPSSQKTISTPQVQKNVQKTVQTPASVRPSSVKPKHEVAKEERSVSKGKKEVEVVEDEEEEKEVAEKEMETDEGKADEPDDGSTKIESGELGIKVKAFVLNKWVTGEVVAVSHSRERWRVKLENATLDTLQSRWYDKTSRDIKVLKPNKDDSDQAELTKELTETRARNEAEEEEAEVVEESAGGSHSPSMSNTVTSQDTTEIPTSSTIASSSTAVLQANEEIANGYRTCLRYFLPPQWVMDKDAVSVLGIQELAAFPLDDFFDHYEKGLRKLVSSFQQEAQNKQQEAEQAVGKLSTVRKMIAKLLKTINEEFEIDSESDSDQVDELLALCLRQALAHARNETG